MKLIAAQRGPGRQVGRHAAVACHTVGVEGCNCASARTPRWDDGFWNAALGLGRVNRGLLRCSLQRQREPGRQRAGAVGTTPLLIACPSATARSHEAARCERQCESGQEERRHAAVLPSLPSLRAPVRSASPAANQDDVVGRSTSPALEGHTRSTEAFSPGKRWASSRAAAATMAIACQEGRLGIVQLLSSYGASRKPRRAGGHGGAPRHIRVPPQHCLARKSRRWCPEILSPCRRHRPRARARQATSTSLPAPGCRRSARRPCARRATPPPRTPSSSGARRGAGDERCPAEGARARRGADASHRPSSAARQRTRPTASTSASHTRSRSPTSSRAA